MRSGKGREGNEGKRKELSHNEKWTRKGKGREQNEGKGRKKKERRYMRGERVCPKERDIEVSGDKMEIR